MLYVLSHRKPKALCLARFIACSVPKWNISFCNSLVSYITLAAQVGPGDPTSCISEHHQSCTKLVTLIEIIWLHRILFFFLFFFLLVQCVITFIWHYKSVSHVISNFNAFKLSGLFWGFERLWGAQDSFAHALCLLHSPVPAEGYHPSWPGLHVAVKLKSEHPQTHVEPPSWAADVEWIRLVSLQTAKGKEKRQSLNPSLLDYVQTGASCFSFLFSTSIRDLDL